MIAPAPPKLMTAEDLWLMPDDEQRYELVKGELRSIPPPGDDHGDLTSNLDTYLRSYVRPRKLGKARVETGFILARNPDTVRAPDISFVRQERDRPSTGGYIDGAPDLAVEIVSPNDKMSEVMEQVQEYLSGGVRLVWVLVYKTRSVLVYRADGSARTLYAAQADTLDGEDVIPGFSVPVSELFDL